MSSAVNFPALARESSRLVYAPQSDMTDQLVSSGEAQRQMEAVSRVAQMSNASVEGGAGSLAASVGDPLREEEDELDELAARLSGP